MDDVIKYKRFVQSITDKPSPIDNQPHRREGVFVWCEDWELIEIGKCLFMGTSVYLGDPPPRRLGHNPLWSQADIVKQAEYLKQQGDADKVIQLLEERRAKYAK